MSSMGLIYDFSLALVVLAALSGVILLIDRLTGGAINAEGRLVMQVTAVGGQTMLAHIIRRVVEALILMAIDFQASMPFMIIALAVLAFFGNSLPLFVGLMGFHSWERYARIARGLAISAGEQGYAAAVRQHHGRIGRASDDRGGDT